MTNELIALANGRPLGSVLYRNSQLSFIYDESWRQDPNSYPLSLSMPLASAEHGHSSIEPFLWGLLPDNDRVLENWARRFQVSARNAFRLITHVGEDCAGAVQFVRPERVEPLRTEPATAEVVWLTEDEIAQRLRTLRTDHSAWRAPTDTGQFSLAGAQPKTALLFEDGKWGVPSGRTPTTHILKPPTGEWDGHAENEHFCLSLARSLGLIVPNSSVRRFGEEVAIVIERYDRVRPADRWFRVHQEDMCQALGVHPARKYESDGGPGVRKIADFLREHSSSPAEDIQSFVDAIAFNWLIAGTDAHAKNYGLLLGANAAVRLAPLYDLASILPYPQIDPKKIKLAMKLGGEYRLRYIGLRHWHKLASELRLDPDETTLRVHTLATQLGDNIAKITRRMTEEGLAHQLIARLGGALALRAAAMKSLTSE
jgi:serine/threonine-protein kinase HipA